MGNNHANYLLFVLIRHGPTRKAFSGNDAIFHADEEPAKCL